jgi:hypothetical protein
MKDLLSSVLMPAVAILVTSAPARTQNHPRMDVQLRGTLEIEGDSTLRKYHARTADLRATIELRDPARADLEREGLEALVRAGQVTRVELSIPIDRIASGDGTLDRHLRAALKADAFPTIRFVADDVRPAPDALALSGRLEIAGVARPSIVQARTTAGSGGLRLVGQQELFMSQFGIKPPTLMFGTLKVADRVIVRFDVAAQLPIARPRPIDDRS